MWLRRNWRSIQSHGKDEYGSFSKSLGLHFNQAVVLGHDSLADGQSESKALLVDALILLIQLSKAFEELPNVVTFDAFASVANVQDQSLGYFVVRHANLDGALLREFKRVLD